MDLELGSSEDIQSESLSVLEVEVTQQISENAAGLPEFIVDLVLGPNRSSQVWRSRLLFAFSLLTALTANAFWLPRELQRAHTSYEASSLPSFLF
jgi:hypothetical protein